MLWFFISLMYKDSLCLDKIKQIILKYIIKKIFNKKDLLHFEEEQASNNIIRRKLYEHIHNTSFGNIKLIKLRYEILYTEYSRIKKINLQKLAKNRNIKTIEMAIELDKNNNTIRLTDNRCQFSQRL